MNYSEEPNKTLIQTYVFYSSETQEDKAFYVSTIDRESSSMYGGRYAETIVWEWDSTERKCGGIVHMESGMQGSTRIHQHVCNEIYKYGKILTDEDEQE